jgi:hypothetical protein
MSIGRRSLAEALAVAAVVACGFPDVTYSNPNGAPEGGSAASDAAEGEDGRAPPSDAMPGDGEGGTDGHSASDAPYQDAAMDSAGPLDCDRDGDGYQARGSPCNGTDCCDTDPNANPGQTQFFTVADSCGSFDYDCDGKLETEYATDIACTGTGLTGCKGGPGFVGDPACGTPGPWASGCQGSGALACQPDSTTSQAQGCQ